MTVFVVSLRRRYMGENTLASLAGFLFIKRLSLYLLAALTFASAVKKRGIRAFVCRIDWRLEKAAACIDVKWRGFLSKVV